MATQRSLCFILLVSVVHGAVRVPGVLPVVPEPNDVLEDKGANPTFAVGHTGERIECERDEDCQASILGSESICSGSHCECKSGTLQSPDTKKCLSEVANLGAGCEETWQCTRRLGENVECKNNYCSCTPDAAVVKNRCWKQISLSGTCKHNDECVGGDDTTCSDGICVCILQKVPHPDNTRCLNVAVSFEDPCEESIQCITTFGDGAKCDREKCVCSSLFHFKNHACMKNLILGESCEHGTTDIDGECFLEESMGIDRVECNTVCQCKEDFVPSKDNQRCLEKGQPDPGTGSATITTPILTNLVTITLARLFAS